MKMIIKKILGRFFDKPRKFFPAVDKRGFDKPRKFFPMTEAEYLLTMRRKGVFGNGTANQL